MTEVWTPPSARVAELMNRAATTALADPGMVDSVNKHCLDAVGPAIADDPSLAAALQATNRANILHWLSRTVVEPGARVTPARSREGVAFARDLVRRGHDASALSMYLVGQNAAWQTWMSLCFGQTADPVELRELLEHSAQSIFTFVQDTIDDLSEAMRSERARLTQGANADRLGLVTMVLEGADLSADVIGARLGHDLHRQQTAAILWHDPATSAVGALDRAATAAGVTAHLGRPLTITASSSSIWAWFSSTDVPDLRAVTSAVSRFPGVSMAVGTTAPGLEGFRRSHADAVVTQRLMARSPSSPSVASFEDVRVAALVTADADRARAFALRTLGDLAGADAALHDTLRTYLREDASAARTARVLYTHRNTVLNRIARAEQLLPAPLEGRGLAIGLALEIVRWLGATPPDA